MVKPISNLQRWKGISHITKKYALGITLVSRQDDTENTDAIGRHPEVRMTETLSGGKVSCFFFSTNSFI